ncbi:MAG: leucine-rich repeat domain-containing protein [Alphaproteobacteria bacterium]|nr:leucine-rich repeat domain-containing protein [Alphaproteobacteria bacterium]
MKKRMFLFWTAVLAVFACSIHAQEATPTSGSCAKAGTDSTCAWSYDTSTKTLTISGTGQMESYFVCCEQNSNEAPWSAYATQLKNVNIGNGITNIGNGAFGWTSVQNVSIPDSVTSLGITAFYNTSKLESVDLPDNLKTMGWGAFQHSGLKSLDLPDSMVSVGAHALATGSLSELTVSDTTKFSEEAFWDRGYAYPRHLQVFCKGQVEVCENNLQNAYQKGSQTPANKEHPSIDTHTKVYRQNRRIYTLEEALQDAKDVNRVTIRYH